YAQIARYDADHIGIAAVRIGDHHLAQAGAMHAFADLEPAANEIVGRMGDGAAGAQVLIGLSDRLGGKEQHVEIVGQTRQHGLDQALGDRGIGHDRKMRTVLLGRRDRQDRKRGIRIKPGKFARLELRPEPLGHYESLGTGPRGGRRLGARAWYSKSPGRHCTAHSGQIESAHAQASVLRARGRLSSSGEKHALACWLPPPRRDEAGMRAVRFLVNGSPCSEDGAAPSMTVLDWLRTRAHLTGTKEGCAEGDCGACTIVLGRRIDGSLQLRAVNSCLMMLPQIDNCAVITVEGLAGPDGALHPVQQALVDADATQAGVCTPGLVMCVFAFHHGGEPADTAIVHEALAGNLCRCTGYRRIAAACRRVANGPADRFVAELPALADALSALPVGADYRYGEQTFLAPRSLAGLFAAMAQAPEAILLAGGTDLGLRVSKDREALPVVISLEAVDELRRITTAADAIGIGGAVTYTDALPHLDRHFPSFGALVRRIGSRQIRNLGTIAGNLATASPIGDTIPCLIALDATVTLASRTGERVLPVESFITGYRNSALAAGEVIAAIRIPLLATGQDFAAYKVCKRFDQDISIVVAAFRLDRRGGKVAELRVAFGGLAARAMRARSVEGAVKGRPWAPAWLADIDALLARDFTPITDHRGGAAYRLRAAAGLLRRFQLATSLAE